jgi:hypothetical protein
MQSVDLMKRHETDVWTVTGCQYYKDVHATRIEDAVLIKKFPIANHPWNIAVFWKECQIGTLTAPRIGDIYPTFPDSGIHGKIVYFVRNLRGQTTQVRVKIEKY